MTVFKYTLIAFASVILQIGNIYAANIYATQDASIKEGDSVNGNWSKNEVYGGSSAIVALVEFNLSGFSANDNVQTTTFRPYVRTLKNDQPSTFSI